MRSPISFWDTTTRPTRFNRVHSAIPRLPGNLNKYVFKYFAPYVQDDWKVTNRLTLNLGLRWDYRYIPYEQSNKLFWIDDQNLPGGSRFTGGGLCFAIPALPTDGMAPARQRLLQLLRPAQSGRRIQDPVRSSHWLCLSAVRR